MEQLFISINRGINTYGANLRNLEAYVMYNKNHDKKSMEEVHKVDDWRMSNIDDLGGIIADGLNTVKSFMVDYEKSGMKEDAVDTVGKIDGCKSRLVHVIISLHYCAAIFEYCLHVFLRSDDSPS